MPKKGRAATARRERDGMWFGQDSDGNRWTSSRSLARARNGDRHAPAAVTP